MALTQNATINYLVGPLGNNTTKKNFTNENICYKILIIINIFTIYLYNDKTTLAAIYPKGAVYITTNTSVPSGFPGTWTEIDADRFLKAVGSNGTTGNFNASNTGSTKLTAAQSGVPAHSHSIASSGAHTHTWASAKAAVRNDAMQWEVTQGPGSGQAWSIASSGAHTHTASNNTATGASEGHNHTPGNPKGYGVHVFVRTA